MKLKNSNYDKNSKTPIVTKLNKSNCYTAQKLKLGQNLNCDKTQKFKM